jgi:predicted ATPase with chaperone activity
VIVVLAELDLFSDPRVGTSPPEPISVEATGLERGMLIDLMLKTLHQGGPQAGNAVARAMHLPIGAIHEILADQRRLHTIEVLGSDRTEFGEGAYIYTLTEEGEQRTQRALARTTYVGPAPVTFEDYVASVQAQSIKGVRITEAQLKESLSDMVVSDKLADEIGPAVNARSSIFFFGPPGNGKTSVASRITTLLGDAVYIPYAIETKGSIIEFFDPVVHTAVENSGTKYDRRWLKVKRPTVVVGGDLTMADLDLVYSPIRRSYEAPYQMKANCGMFLIDDFGRQAMSPQQLLNRWIVPLESRVDFLTLQTGTKLEVPFDELIVFSTNLDPADLVDEAFLRRIKYKIFVEDPSPEAFHDIFVQAAESFNIEFNEDAYHYLIETYYRGVGRPARAVHPRDLLDQVVALCRYKGWPPEMTRSMMDSVVRTYFAQPTQRM